MNIERRLSWIKKLGPVRCELLQRIGESQTMKEISLSTRINIKTLDYHRGRLAEILGISKSKRKTYAAVAIFTRRAAALGLIDMNL